MDRTRDDFYLAKIHEELRLLRLLIENFIAENEPEAHSGYLLDRKALNEGNIP